MSALFTTVLKDVLLLFALESAILAAFARDFGGGVVNLSRPLRALRLRAVGREAPSIGSGGRFKFSPSVSPCMLPSSATESSMPLSARSAFCSLLAAAAESLPVRLSRVLGVVSGGRCFACLAEALNRLGVAA